MKTFNISRMKKKIDATLLEEMNNLSRSKKHKH